jgi:hypothetical protein
VTERFAFYDVYGYLLPGLLLIGVLWFPVWFVPGRPLPAEWAAVIAATLVIGYITGHVLSGIAEQTFPHRDRDGSLRWPSDHLLDDDSPIFEREFKARLIESIKARLGFDVQSAGKPDPQTQQRRQEAFLACRAALIQRKLASYAEQFQGMYVMFRGWAAAAVLSAFYQSGWISGRWVPDQSLLCIYLVIGALLAALVTVNWALRRDRRLMNILTFWILATVLLALGAVWAAQTRSLLTLEKQLALGGVALASLFFFERFHAAYRYFAQRFAETVYRDFYALSRYPVDQPK